MRVESRRSYPSLEQEKWESGDGSDFKVSRSWLPLRPAGVASERSARGECVTATCACQVYEVRADPCGYCLILNNVTFSRDSHLSNRDGSDVDCEKLEKRFRALRFYVLTRRDLKARVRPAALS